MSSEILSANSLSCTSLFASRSFECEFQVSSSTFQVEKKSKTSGLKHETGNLKRLAPLCFTLHTIESDTRTQLTGLLNSRLITR